MPPKGSRKRAVESSNVPPPKKQQLEAVQQDHKPPQQNVDNVEDTATNGFQDKPATRKKVPHAQRHLESGVTNAFDQLLEPFYYGKGLTDPIRLAEDKWNLIPAFLKVKGVVSQHIDSFNHFVEFELKKIIDANQTIRSELDDKFFFKYTNVYVGYPCRVNEEFYNAARQVTPNECRNRDLTYAAPIYVDVRYLLNHEVVTAKRQFLGRLPIMLKSSKCVLKDKDERDLSRSKECPLDPGGYFIIKGQEKVILIQEQISKNRIIVESHKGIIQASVTSASYESKSKSYVLLHKGKILLRHNTFNEDIPIVIVMKALGVTSDQEIAWLITASEQKFHRLFDPNFDEAHKIGVVTQQQALEYIGQRVRLRRGFMSKGRPRNLSQEAMDALSNIIMSHIAVEGLNLKPKAVFIALMTKRLLLAIDNPNMIDDRDYLGNKRLELAGQMLGLLFEDAFKKFNTAFQRTIDSVSKRQNRLYFNALDHFKVHSGFITSGFERALASGNWNLVRFRMNRSGITTPLSRLSYISALGTLTRISSQFEKSRKVSGPRALQPSQFGMLCPADTPEGESCGLAKNLALMTHITTKGDAEPVKKVLFMLGAEGISLNTGSTVNDSQQYVVFVDGTPMAITKEPKLLQVRLKQYRRSGRIGQYVSVHTNHSHQAVHIATDDGRVCRPLVIVEEGESKITHETLQSLREGTLGYHDVLARGLVEYIDVNEENDCLIAFNENDVGKTTTHMEIDPFTILGVVAGVIPYPHHNQSPRNTYQCAMGKQAIGAIAFNQFSRLDPLLYTMVYPQKPLVKTRAMDMIQYDQLPAGQNAVVAVMSYSSFDIEDAIILNKASCDRGFGRCQVFRKHTTLYKANKYGAKEMYGRGSDKEDLNEHGFIDPRVKVKKNSVLWRKLMPPNSPAVNEYAKVADTWQTDDTKYKNDNPAIIDKVLVTETDAGVRLLKVQTRQTRVPEVGDKFSSRHGQKGCVGLMANPEDLPFDEDGVTPDIVMNPHGFPSRMTVGKVLELISGKIAAEEGKPQYSSAFGVESDDVSQALIDHGFTYSGKTEMTCGITGESIPSFIFTGPVYYQKLKHMVEDKMHGRASGPKAMLTRQPTEGRQKGGGLRLGEMERDCLIAHGASHLLIERLMLSSDKFDCDVCEECGQIGYRGWCQSCKSAAAMSRMQIPYAAKLLIQELMGMNIKATFQFGKATTGV